MIEHSEQINELAAALAKAQAEMKGALKDATNPHFNSKYAGLDSVWEACRPALTSHGISVVQAPGAQGNAVSMTTMLLHTSGQWMRSTLDMTAADQRPQAIGSCITYARRYGLSAMAGIAPEDDDDGNAAQGGAQGPKDRGARREALQAEARKANADAGPYAHDEPALANYAELMARRAKLPADVQVHVPTDEDMHAVPPTELTDLVPSYVEAIIAAVKRRKLSSEEQGALKLMFLGNARAQLTGQKHNPFFIYAFFKHMRTDEP